VSVPVAVFASGSGTNLQALLDHEPSSGRYRIALVVADRSEAGALERARRAGRSAEVVPVSGRPPERVARDTLELLEEEGIRVVLLAGYLRLLPPALVRTFPRRMLNIHPALLPSFGGKGMYGRHIHEAVLESGARVTGVTIHCVDEEYDRGRILAQWPVPVRAGDTPETLGARVLRVEHLLYPRAADHLCRAVEEGREPAPFQPPGRAFGVLEEDTGELLEKQIEAAFSTG